MAKLFYVKWHLLDGVLILDQQKKKKSSSEMLVVPYRITARQGNKLKKRITDRFLYKKRKPFINEIEFEFRNLFHICKECSFVTDKEKVNKAWGNLCNRCFREYQNEKKKEYQRNKDYRKKIRTFKEYLTTEQGKVDAVPNEVIKSNVRIEVIKQNKTMREVAHHLNLSDKQMCLFFDKRRIDVDALQAICEYLTVPMERMIRMPRGVRIRRKKGIPAWWFDDDFRMKNV